MNFNKKEWVDRQVEFPNRRVITNNDTGETTSATITRDEGEVITPGDLLDAYNLNDLENRIQEAVDSKSSVSITPYQAFGAKVAYITIDGKTDVLYAPAGGGSGSSVEVEQVLTEGTEIAKIKVDGESTSLYAPAGGGGSGLGDEFVQAILAVCAEVPHDSEDGEGRYYKMYLNVVDNEDGTSTGDLFKTNYSGLGDVLIIFLTTYSETDSWEISWSDYTYNKHVVATGSGIVTNKIIYITGDHDFNIVFQTDKPVKMLMPGGNMVD